MPRAPAAINLDIDIDGTLAVNLSMRAVYLLYTVNHQRQQIENVVWELT